jgi:AraC-like DNA-binding protein
MAPHAAIAHALRRAPGRIDELQREAGVSPRHFIALFRGVTGITPKHYFRLQRFGSAAAALAMRDGGLADVAAAAGYADQAHLTREFRDLAGFTPGRYRPAAPDRPLHHLSTDDR